MCFRNLKKNCRKVTENSKNLIREFRIFVSGRLKYI